MLTKIHSNQYNSKTLPFADGKVNIYTIEKRSIKDYLGTFDFREETVGVQAYTNFQVLGIQIDKVISIPLNDIAEVGRVLKINQDDYYYQISLVQKKDTLPKSLRLSLTKTNIRWMENND